MKIRSAAILGAGAVGSYLLWGLTDKPGVTVSVVAEGARADRLRRAGCTINGKTIMTKAAEELCRHYPDPPGVEAVSFLCAPAAENQLF